MCNQNEKQNQEGIEEMIYIIMKLHNHLPDTARKPTTCALIILLYARLPVAQCFFPSYGDI